MTVVAAETSEGLIRWRYLPWALAAIAAMIAVIVAGNIWLLDFVHVFSSLLWTGVDLFMGFVLGPILRRVDLSVRREIVRRLTPRTRRFRIAGEDKMRRSQRGSIFRRK